MPFVMILTTGNRLGFHPHRNPMTQDVVAVKDQESRQLVRPCSMGFDAKHLGQIKPSSDLF